jgi:predicted neuraminidase
MYKSNKLLLFILAAMAIFTLLAIRWWPEPVATFSSIPTIATHNTPVYHEQFISFGETSAVHAPAISQRDDGKLLAVWYAGTREGAKDVAIASTIIDPDSYTLSPAHSVASRLQTEKDTWRYIRKLGNPIVHQLADGRMMLIYVSVSFGGWAASNLNIRFSDDGGLSWDQSKRLVTSPFINISTLVKGTPVNLVNGDIGIPVYHEFMGKFSEFLILDSQGNIKNKHRISWGRDAIQPVIIPVTPQKAIALLRDSGEIDKRIGFSVSNDTGQHWSTPTPLNLPNPNAAVAASSANNTIISVFNNHEDERNDLTLAISKDQGVNWNIIHQFESEALQPGKKVEFSYPYLIRDDKGGFHLVYTWHKKRIKYIHFNQAWLSNTMTSDR